MLNTSELKELVKRLPLQHYQDDKWQFDLSKPKMEKCKDRLLVR
jgi:hypothetical protein